MAKENKESIIMTVDEVAEYLKLSKITVYKLTQKGEIPGFPYRKFLEIQQGKDRRDCPCGKLSKIHRVIKFEIIY